MIVVSDTSPITNLAAIGQLDLLRQLYQKIILPEAVYQELMASGGQHPGAIVSSLDWIEVQSATNQLLVTSLRIELDQGEAEAIALAQQTSADLLLIDERRGRAAAERFGLRVLGLLGILSKPNRKAWFRNSNHTWIRSFNPGSGSVSNFIIWCSKPLENEKRLAMEGKQTIRKIRLENFLSYANKSQSIDDAANLLELVDTAKVRQTAPHLNAYSKR